jgi:hypothetical protein
VVTGDNAVEVFINGVSVGSSSDWQQSSTFFADLTSGDVIAVHATDAGGIGGLLAHIEWDGNTSVTDASWRATTSLETDWATTGFDDTGWDQATTYGQYGVAPWFTNVAGFPTGSNAEWIWTDDSSGDNDIYLRYTIETP